MSLLRTLVSSRLLHFLVPGALIFALAPAPQSGTDIRLTTEAFKALEASEARRLGTPALDASVAAEVRQRAIEDEILYREALRLGLDKDDKIVRGRLIQKLLFLAEDLGGASKPATDDDLKVFYANTLDRWKRPEKVRFFHIYVGERSKDRLPALREEALAWDNRSPTEVPALGQAFLLPREAEMSREELTNEYGADFASGAFGLATGTWSQPIASRFGWHLVKVVERRPAGQATFEEVRGELPLLYLVERKQKATEAFIREATARYHIEIDAKPVQDFAPAGRVAKQMEGE